MFKNFNKKLRIFQTDLIARTQAWTKWKSPKKRECLCKVRMDYNILYSTATEDRKNEAEAYAKCSHMNCYLENTPPGNCKYVVPTIKQKQLANDVPEQECP